MSVHQRVPTMDWSPESGDFTNQFQGIWWNYHGIRPFKYAMAMWTMVISGCESKHRWLTYNIKPCENGLMTRHQYEYSNLSKSWPMAHMEPSYSTETIAHLSIWRRACLTNMIQEFIKIIIPNHCPDGGLRARTGDIGTESRPLSLFFFMCQMTQRQSSSVLPFSTCVYVLQQLGRPSRPSSQTSTE